MTDSEDKKVRTSPSVFYKTASTSPEKKDHKRSSNTRTDRKSNSGRSDYKERSNESSSHRKRQGNQENRFANRVESFKGNERKEPASPWKSKPAKIGHSSEHRSAPRHFNKNELYVYGENSCKAVARFRPEAIIKVFITEGMLKRFSELLSDLAKNQMGYDIVDSQAIERLTQTPHHGGIAFIIKRRRALSVAEYLEDEGYGKTDTILAIDDIANPHNLGGIARTAAFFNLNGLMIRQSESAENSAAIRVSEGGMESMKLIQADDFIADLLRLKKSGYKIVAVLPVKTQSIRSIALEKAKFERTKTVFVIFQQINERVTEIADDILSVQGSSVMPALNISVLTGIVLATWQNRMH